MDLKLPYREQNSNKGTFGKVLNISGSKNYIGAAYLSSLAVLKAGAGYVALASEKNIMKSVSILLPETVFLSRSEGYKRINNFDVFLIGCGLGQSFLSKFWFRKFINKLQNSESPLVIDADGLNILSKYAKDKAIRRFAQNEKISPRTLRDGAWGGVVITPHPAEAARLLGVNTDEILANPEQSAKELSKKYNCVTVLKTHRTVVCSQNEEIYINEHGNSALAKAGTGDVLAGIISGLLAQKMELFEAAKLGVYLHSRAGELASKDLTEYSVLASELIGYIPLALKELIQSPHVE